MFVGREWQYSSMNVYRMFQRGIDNSVDVCVDVVSRDDGCVDASSVLAA